MKKSILLVGAFLLACSAGALERKYTEGFAFEKLPVSNGRATSGLSFYNGGMALMRADSSYILSLPDSVGVLASSMAEDQVLTELQREGQFAFDAKKQLLYVSHEGLLYQVDVKTRAYKLLDIEGMGPYRKGYEKGSSVAYRRWRFKEPGVSGFYNPALSADGKKLYFSAELDGGKGGRDIWMIQPKTDGSWSAPVNVSSANSPSNEDFPFLAGDSVLYFSSDRADTLQGWNVFRMPLKAKKGTNVQALVLPEGVNSNGDDFNFVGTDKTVFVVSNRGGADEVYSPLRLQVEEPVADTAAAQAPEVVPATDGGKAPSVPERIVPAFEPCVFYFLFDKDAFAYDYSRQIQKVARYLKENPSVVLSLSGHTDVRGELDYNMSLSERRAQKVFNCLVDAGVPKAQLKEQAFGKSHLAVEDAATQAEHLKNRRVELKVEE